ncbi:DNA polymerase elongation subunit family B [Haloarcula tailed virus 2]|uniref:DNA-directed DNA polymerase n=1 Tax=Haloarcula tailed virus 2 TaxID=2877989 RepID=A0AAE8XZV1_9CAUD|nr:DNA polymerase elongation subunit family B [Haloarcula tailed virus 2]UBF23197.1 DNA polymerase elongation subunit family B [Haloarcula tailed virus 2]
MSMAQFADIKSEPDTLDVRIMNVETENKFGQPVVHLYTRHADGTPYHLEVTGHQPSFLIKETEYTERLDNHFAVSGVATSDRTTIHGEPLKRVFTNTQDGIKELKDMFHETFEADVWFQHRFLLDKGIRSSVGVDVSHAESTDDGYKLSAHAVHAVDDVTVDPRTITVDIEVIREDGFPHADKAHWPIVSMVAHDSQTGDVKTCMLRSDDWDNPFMAFPEGVEIYGDERQMLNEFLHWIGDRNPDVLAGWYSNDFDWPYILNRCSNLTMNAHRSLSPTGDVWVSDYWGDANGKGIEFFDYLEGYKKTQFHTLRDKSLDAIAEKELNRGKLDLHEIEGAPAGSGAIYGWAWRNAPETFIDYNIRDVMACVEIDNEVGITNLFNHLRNISGSLLSDLVGNNINMIDNLVLHEAMEAGVALPTSTKPDEDWYFGAYVFQPKAGLHTDVVYPDYASLYPNMMAQINMSPETIVGTKAELIMSEYDESDCVWSYVDARPVARVEKGEDYDQYKDGSHKAVMRHKGGGNWETVWFDDPQLTRMYYLKPEVKQGFVSTVIADLLEMKYEYKGTDQYTAVKQVCNSVYGVFGDSNSFGTGFRLFDWRIAESITLGGREMIQNGAEVFESACVEHGASAAPLVGGDTDSIMTSIKGADDWKHAVEIANKAAEDVNDWHDDFCQERFNVPADQHRMDLEVESYSPKCFFVQDEDEAEGVGKKKRYVTLITVEDGEVLDEPKMNIKGFEAIRSDKSKATMDTQKMVFNALMTEDVNDARDMLDAYLTDMLDGNIPLEDIAIPFGMNKNLDDYFKPDRKAMPWFAGAVYANEHIYQDEQIKKGGDQFYFYVDGVDMTLPQTYGPRTQASEGCEVNCVSVSEPKDLPDAVHVDYQKMIDKTLKNPMAPICNTLGWDWAELKA